MSHVISRVDEVKHLKFCSHLVMDFTNFFFFFFFFFLSIDINSSRFDTFICTQSGGFSRGAITRELPIKGGKMEKGFGSSPPMRNYPPELSLSLKTPDSKWKAKMFQVDIYRCFIHICDGSLDIVSLSEVE